MHNNMQRYFSIFLLLFINNVCAQPTLTAQNTPVVPDLFFAGHIPVHNTGNTGSNVTWDFSTLVPADTINVDYGFCTSVNGCTLYPGALIERNNFFVSIFYANSAAETVYETDTTIYYSRYTNPYDRIRFPFTYGSTYTDSFAGTTGTVASQPGIYTYRRGALTVEADAYGTLKLPVGTFYNVLRVKRTMRYQDSTAPQLAPQANTSTSYSWYSPDKRVMLMYVNIRRTDTNSIFTYQSPVGIGQGHPQQWGNVQLSPNPAKDLVSIALTVSQPDSYVFSLSGINGGATGIAGSGNFSRGKNSFSLNVSGLPAGIYFLKINSGINSAVYKISKI